MARPVVAVLLGVLIVGAGSASAGCIGPVINGQCEGQAVPWDTHPPQEQHPDPPAGFQWDWRGTAEQQRHPTEIDPFTGRDPHDSQWHQRQNAPPVFTLPRRSPDAGGDEDEDADDE